MSRTIEALMPWVSTDELCITLEEVLSDHFGARQRIDALRRRPGVYRSSFMIEDLDVCLADGTTVELVFKDVSARALLDVARRTKPSFVADPLREIETYRALLAPHRLGTATCYGAAVDPARGRYWLFLERVAGVDLQQMGALTAWQEAARWLAMLHSRFAGDPDLLARTRPAHLLDYDGDFYRCWIERARVFLSRTRQVQPERERRFKRLASRYDQVVERLVALPVTLIHGEFYPSNVLIGDAVGGTRVCPVDWEMTAVGPGLIDLAALTAGRWTEQERTQLVLAYHVAIARDGGRLPAEALLTTLDYCRLHLAVQWLGWAVDWSPPRLHAQDWLGEALRLAERLGL